MFRSRRPPDRRSPIKSPFLRHLQLDPDHTELDYFPFTLPFLARGDFELELTRPVTFLVGENGSGKSTLLEAIAHKCGFNPLGGGQANRFGIRDERAEAPGRSLGNALSLAWQLKVTDGFFFRAESFHQYASYLDEIYDGAPDHRSLHRLSHGEAFLTAFEEKMSATFRGLYLLDEPEAALSPARQIEFLAAIEEGRQSGNGQYLIATHSPILMAYPGADILMFSHRGIRRATLDETPHFQLYQEFFADPDRWLAREMERAAHERQETRERAARVDDASSSDEADDDLPPGKIRRGPPLDDDDD